MTILFVILILLASVILGFFVLIQNPKGGGLAGDFGGVSSQYMGVKQTNNVLERGTWIFAGVIGVLSICSTFFISGTSSSNGGRLQDVSNAPVQSTVPQPAATPNTITLPATAAPSTDSGK